MLNITPHSFKDWKPLRFWCQKVLPLVYDDSLSYMELLAKVVHYLNELGADLDDIEVDIQQIFQAYNDLINQVNLATLETGFYPSAQPWEIGEAVSFTDGPTQGFCMKDPNTAVLYHNSTHKFTLYNLNNGNKIGEYARNFGKLNDLTYDPTHNVFYAVDANDDSHIYTIYKLNGDNFNTVETHVFNNKYPHGLAWSDAEQVLYGYHQSGSTVEMMIIDPSDWTYTTLFNVSANIHAWQGMTYDGDYFYIVTYNPECIVRFDKYGNYVSGNELTYTIDGHYLGELQSIDYVNGKFVLNSTYTDYANGSYYDTMIGDLPHLKPRVYVFSYYSPYSHLETVNVKARPSVSNNIMNVYINYDEAAWHPTGESSKPFATLAQALSFKWPDNYTCTFRVYGMPTLTSPYIPVISRLRGHSFIFHANGYFCVFDCQGTVFQNIPNTGGVADYNVSLKIQNSAVMFGVENYYYNIVANSYCLLNRDLT